MRQHLSQAPPFAIPLCFFKKKTFLLAFLALELVEVAVKRVCPKPQPMSGRNHNRLARGGGGGGGLKYLDEHSDWMFYSLGENRRVVYASVDMSRIAS